MKHGETPIPVRSVICLPRWLLVISILLCGACMAAGLALAIWGIATQRGGSLGGALGGAFGCLIGGAGGLFGTLCDWRRRLPAPVLLAHVQQDMPSQYYRRVFWPALCVAVIGTAIGTFVWSHPALWHGVVQTCGILACMAGGMEVIRRHTTAQARAVFGLYADGLLDAADAAAIDDARSKDPKFDAAVREHQRVAQQLRQIGADQGRA